MNHFIVKCHGINVSTDFYKVPDDTYIITVTATGVSLRDLYEKMSAISVGILATDPPVELFENGNTTKTKTKTCERYEANLRRQVDPVIEDGEIIVRGEHGDPNINFRNHLPGEELPNIYLSTDEPNAHQKQFFGVHTKKTKKPITIDNGEIHMLLSDFVKQKGRGVYILFVCRTDEGLSMFKSAFKHDQMKQIINRYLDLRIQGENTDTLLSKFKLPLRPILKDLGDKGIPTIDEAMEYLNDNPTPPLALSRAHSQTTDTNEDQIQKVQKYYVDEKEKTQSTIPDIISELQQDLLRMEELKMKSNDRSKEKAIDETMDEIDKTIKSISRNPLPEFSVDWYAIQELERKINALPEKTVKEKETKKESLKTLTVLKSFSSPYYSTSTLRNFTHRTQHFGEEIDGGKTKRKRRRKTNKYKRR